jgi:hypothetical protein
MPFIYLAQQVKQYSSDVTAAIAILLMVLEVRRRGVTAMRSWAMGIAGAVLAWCSQPSVFVLAGASLALIVMAVRARDGRSGRILMIALTLWAASAAAAGLYAVRLLSAEELRYFQWFWDGGFMPFPPRSVADAAWILYKLTWAFGAFATDLSRAHGGLNYRWSWIFTGVCLIGMWVLTRRQREVGVAIVVPLLLTAAVSAVHVYPFTARLFAFLLPGLVLATAAGAEYVLSVVPDRLRALSPVAMAVLGGAPIVAIATALPPYRPQHTRPLIEHVATHVRPGEALYVHFGAGQAFRYYERRGVISLPSGDVVMGRCETASSRAYLRQLDRLRGRSGVWFLVSTTTETASPAALTHGYLSQIGRLRASVVMPGAPGYPIEAAALYYYDLSDPVRLLSSTAEAFPVGPGVATSANTEWLCWGVATPDVERQ